MLYAMYVPGVCYVLYICITFYSIITLITLYSTTPAMLLCCMLLESAIQSPETDDRVMWCQVTVSRTSIEQNRTDREKHQRKGEVENSYSNITREQEQEQE